MHQSCTENGIDLLRPHHDLVGGLPPHFPTLESAWQLWNKSWRNFWFLIEFILMKKRWLAAFNGWIKLPWEKPCFWGLEGPTKDATRCLRQSQCVKLSRSKSCDLVGGSHGEGEPTGSGWFQRMSCYKVSWMIFDISILGMAPSL